MGDHRRRRGWRERAALTIALAAGVLALPSVALAPEAQAAGPCDPPVVNEIACENSLPGSPASEWDVSGSGSPDLQGFSDDISYAPGDVATFKVSTPATDYRLDIYRMGYYGGSGARKVATVQPSAALPQPQPACVNETSTGLIDCGNWAPSAQWPVPLDAVSGIYFAKLVREDGTVGSSHVVFVVRDDSGGSDLLFQTSDTTWQAYNRYGGNSLYRGSPDGRAYKVSYNRPLTTRGTDPHDSVFNAEYPMVRFLERNGYDVSYTSGIDTHRRGAELLEHKVFLSVGHDEYWSAGQRANVEAAREAGVHLAFFSGNAIFWKTRWEGSIAGPATAHRTLVSYKESRANAKIDPSPEWTGTWRDARFSPPSDGGRPENALQGTLFTVNGPRDDAIKVPAADGRLRLWRNTSVATLPAGGVATFPAGTLGYEWDEDVDNGHRPAGLFRLSEATYTVHAKLQDTCCTYASGSATHHALMYRHSSGALVFGAGTVQWSWGLDSSHDRAGTPVDVRMQQATVNLLADMGTQPATLMAGLVAATASTDAVAPSTGITSAPPAGASLPAGTPVTISGTAADAGGQVAGVEVSLDGGYTWHPAGGRSSWTYTFTPSVSGPVAVRARAVDDTGNLGPPVQPDGCPCTIWADSATPALASSADTNAVELGVKFRADVSGTITGIRFYKGPANTGTHTGSLWTRTGTLLARATFTNETATGWQTVTFSAPVAVTAGTTYVASYHTTSGGYSEDVNYFKTAGVDRGPLHALKQGIDGNNGVYAYSGSPTFPTSGSSKARNYWVDVVFQDAGTSDTTPPQVTGRSPAPGATGVSPGSTVTVTFDEPIQPATLSLSLRDPSNAVVPGSTSYDSATRTATFQPSGPLTASTTYTATVAGATDLSGNAMPTPVTWSFTTAAAPTSLCPCTIWADSATPALASSADTNAVELGVKFRADVSGTITGIRFYKGPANTGTHTGSLWTRTGTLLARATFTNETATGWQTVTFSAPVAVTAGTTYVASYHTTSGGYSEDVNYFKTAGVDRGPLHALKQGIDGNNGVYAYSGSPTFPTSGSSKARNYWVDVVFQD